MWLLANWKIVTMAAGVVAIFFSGYHLRTLRYEAAQAKAMVKVIDKLGEGLNENIRFNGKLDEAISNTKDDCLNRDIPDAVRLLLSNPKRVP